MALVIQGKGNTQVPFIYTFERIQCYLIGKGLSVQGKQQCQDTLIYKSTRAAFNFCEITGRCTVGLVCQQKSKPYWEFFLANINYYYNLDENGRKTKKRNGEIAVIQ